MLRRQQNPLSDEFTFSFHTTEKSHLIYRTSFASRDLRSCSRGGGGGGDPLFGCTFCDVVVFSGV